MSSLIKHGLCTIYAKDLGKGPMAYEELRNISWATPEINDQAAGNRKLVQAN